LVAVDENGRQVERPSTTLLDPKLNVL
jgi:hypothetical protein